MNSTTASHAVALRRWKIAYRRSEEEHGESYADLAGSWRVACQWSAFYKLSCMGKIQDYDHAQEVADECRHCLRFAGGDDADALRRLETLAELYPCFEFDDDDN